MRSSRLALRACTRVAKIQNVHTRTLGEARARLLTSRPSGRFAGTHVTCTDTCRATARFELHTRSLTARAWRPGASAVGVGGMKAAAIPQTASSIGAKSDALCIFAKQECRHELPHFSFFFFKTLHFRFYHGRHIQGRLQ